MLVVVAGEEVNEGGENLKLDPVSGWELCGNEVCCEKLCIIASKFSKGVKSIEGCSATLWGLNCCFQLQLVSIGAIEGRVDDSCHSEGG